MKDLNKFKKARKVMKKTLANNPKLKRKYLAKIGCLLVERFCKEMTCNEYDKIASDIIDLTFKKTE